MKQKQQKKNGFQEWLKAIVIALVIVLGTRMFLFTTYRVSGLSMSPTLADGEALFATVLDVKLGDIERGDIIICRYPKQGTKKFVKRVIGVAGDRIVFDGSQTYVNGELQAEEYVTYPSSDSGEYLVPEGCVFVCGDNRAASNDSRSSEVGAIRLSNIIGKVRWVIWPFASMRSVQETEEQP